MKRTILLSVLVLAAALNASAKVQLPSLFTDNMVLQQQSDVKIWGMAKAGKKVTLETSWDGAVYETKADAEGAWSVVVKTCAYGGPYTVTISDGKKLVLSNVLLGDVWLCGGQSNMEMKVGNRVSNMAQAQAAASGYRNVRLLHVENTISTHPVKDVEIRHGGWQTCDENTILDFSAAGYFFGTTLSDNLDIPIGLIESCWGGTLAEAWTSGPALEQMPYFQEKVKKAALIPETREERTAMFHKELQEWTETIKSYDPAFTDGNLVWGARDFDDSSWPEIVSPGYIQDNGFPNYSGYLWMRKTVDVPASWAGKDLVLDLAIIDDNEFTYFNGEFVGHTEGCWTRRTYTLPASMVKPGKNVIAVRVMDTGGKGGFCGNASDMALRNGSESIALAGNWKYHFAMGIGDAPDLPVNTTHEPNFPTFLYNAMIYPLLDTKIKGAIWYQGEANAPRAEQYKTLLPLMINDWRESWGYCFPFYLCQLANYQAEQTEAEESEWAELREAQLETLNLENTGMAVLIDIGEAADIHPKNKVEVGRRLALNALALTYGKDVEYSGPVYDSYKIENGKIRIGFKFAKGLCTRNGEALSGFYIAGPDHQFVPAEAVIDGESVVVSSASVSFPVAVRYGWANNPYCNLYNAAGLPASPFRTDAWASRRPKY